MGIRRRGGGTAADSPDRHSPLDFLVHAPGRRFRKGLRKSFSVTSDPVHMHWILDSSSGSRDGRSTKKNGFCAGGRRQVVMITGSLHSEICRRLPTNSVDKKIASLREPEQDSRTVGARLAHGEARSPSPQAACSTPNIRCCQHLMLNKFKAANTGYFGSMCEFVGFQHLMLS